MAIVHGVEKESDMTRQLQTLLLSHTNTCVCVCVCVCVCEEREK